MSNPAGKAWQCVDCHFVNPPVRCKLTDIPALRCGRPGCNTLSAISYEWRMTEAFTVDRGSKQNIHIDIPIYTQIGNTCGAYACTVVTRLMWKLHFAWTTRSYLGAEPDVGPLILEYNRLYKHTFPKDKDGKPKLQGIELDKILHIILRHGIPIKGDLEDPRPVLEIKSFSRVDHSDVEQMTKLIADGYPLVGRAPMGRLQHLITCGEVYHAPECDPKLPGHAFALIGSGLGYKSTAGREPVHETFFIARDSAGHWAHPSIKGGKSNRGQGMGGDFLVWSSDLYEVWGIEVVDNYLS